MLTRVLRPALEERVPRLPGDCKSARFPSGDPGSIRRAARSCITTGRAGRPGRAARRRPLRGVWGSGGTDVFAVGVTGTLLHGTRSR